MKNVRTKVVLPTRRVNEFADVLLDMVERMPKKHLRRMDFCGHLGVSPNPICTYGRIIIRMHYFMAAFQYIHNQITEDEFWKIQKEYYRLDYEYWGERKFDTYHKRLLLPKL